MDFADAAIDGHIEDYHRERNEKLMLQQELIELKDKVMEIQGEMQYDKSKANAQVNQ